MANRKRNIQIKFYVTEDEKRLIDEKMSQLPTRRYGAYLRDPPPCHRQGNEPGSPSNPSLSAWGGYAGTGP